MAKIHGKDWALAFRDFDERFHLDFAFAGILMIIGWVICLVETADGSFDFISSFGFLKGPLLLNWHPASK